MKELNNISSTQYADDVFDKIDKNFDDVKSAIDTIEQGGGSQAPAEIQTVDTSTLGGGRFAKAVEKADLDPSALWQWVLKTTDGQGNAVRKIIWHVGGGEFIDAQGTPIIQTQS